MLHYTNSIFESLLPLLYYHINISYQLYFHLTIKHNIHFIYIQQQFRQRTKATLYGGVTKRPGRPERDYP